MIAEGIINVDTEAAKQLGFTSDCFNPASYLWKRGNTIVISFIMSKRKGMFCRLMQTIRELGFDFEIPTPCNRMIEIGIKQNWNFYQKEDCVFGVIEFLTNKKEGANNERSRTNSRRTEAAD